tara:strand:+ start:6549 stop:7376 length:828 start_codon:yes stop_codon:yes gene_type:complete
MNKKYFVINEDKNFISQEDILSIEKEKIEVFKKSGKELINNSNEISAKLEASTLKHTKGRVIVVADKEQKNYTSFSDGTTIRLERDYNNLDRKYTQQCLGKVIDAESIPKGSLVLFHHNALHDTYKVFNHSLLDGQEITSGVSIYSIPENQCYLYKETENSEWMPCTVFATALRVFEPYKGMLEGVLPTKIKDSLYVLTGTYKGQVVKTQKACDAEIIFRNEKGTDSNIIRFRPLGDIESDREPEAICLMNELTERVDKNELLIGISDKDCKTLK